MVLKRVVLPTPLGPITPTMPLRGSSKDKSSMSTRPSNSLCRFFATSTFEPKRGPAGIWISAKSSFFALSASATMAS